MEPHPSPLSNASSHLDEIVQDACQLHLPTASSRRSPTPLSKQQHRRSQHYILRKQRPRPQVTLRYMQSLDGSLTVPDTNPLPDPADEDQDVDSMEASMMMSGSDDSLYPRIPKPHKAIVQFIGRLRSNHEAIIIGVNTIIRYDPALHGSHKEAIPVILDTDLAIPSSCQLLQGSGREGRPIIFAKESLEGCPKQADLESAGVQVCFVPVDQVTGYLDLPAILQILHDRFQFRKVIVEGGVRVLESFIREGLFDKLVLMIVPRFGVGRALFQQLEEPEQDRLREALPRLRSIRYDVLGSHLIMSAEPDYE